MLRRTLLLVAAFGVPAVLPAKALAYRPFDSTDADVAERGECEIDLQPLGILREGEARWLIAPQITLNLGVPFPFPSEVVVDASGLDPTTRATGANGYSVQYLDLAMKTAWRQGSLQGEAGASIATETALLLPGSDVRGKTVADEDHFGFALNAILSERWEPVAVHFNLEPGLSRAQHFSWFSGAIVEGPLEWKLAPAMEFTVETEASAATSVGILAGGMWRISKDLVVDAGVRYGRLWQSGTAVPTFEGRLGVSWSFQL